MPQQYIVIGNTWVKSIGHSGKTFSSVLFLSYSGGKYSSD